MTAVEWLEEQTRKPEWHSLKRQDIFDQAKEMEKEQAELYAEFAVLNDRSGNPLISFNEFINIDNL
jgi:hypothetical protein